MRIALGSDHAGYELKIKVIRYFHNEKIGFTDFGCYTFDAADYPIYARKVCEAVLSGEFDKGILFCNTGIGMSVAANRYNGIRAALCRDARTAVSARSHNDANVLVIGARVTDYNLTVDVIKTFFATEFSNAERHIRRVGMLDGPGRNAF